MGIIAVTLKLSDTPGVNERGGQSQARVIQEVTNCVLIKNQSPYSLTDLEPPPCELSNDVGINSLECTLQEIRVFSHVFSYSGMDFSSGRLTEGIIITMAYF